jgi:3-hydroxy acid dehydrogenase/malonic semialdehyde reductase
MQGTVFITGASSGFGEGCARRFAKEGWQLVLVARRLERLELLQKELGGKEKIHIVSLDVQHETAVKKAVDELPEKFRKIDVLVNNAGLALGLEPSQAASMEDWEKMVDTNIKGLLFCTRSLLPGMVKQNSGHIINLGSIAGDWPYPGGNVYGATKAFVAQFSRNLRADLLGTKIRVTNIEPGLAETEFSLVRFKGDSKRAKGVYKGIHPLTAEDIAEIVFWVTNLPKHVNINRVEVMPAGQAWGPLALDRREE